MKPIHRYGVRLRPMQAGDLERVRRWRNAPHVRREMAYQEHITPAMQADWWRNLDPFCNAYYLIEYKGTAIGVVHAKDIDWLSKTAETGIFIGKRDYLAGFVPVLAVLALMDDLFEIQGMQALQAKVRTANSKIVDFNRRLGYHSVSEEEGFLRLQVTRDQYYAVAKSLREMARRMSAPSL